ncbi:MAG TPA: transketolase C-terminal domain-containing protein [Gemmatimonadaceae bacterium]|nr:transketolase C-terminal domain-containing protein [Gemmatimonadaceae bacterium]
MRTTFIRTLIEVAAENDNVWLVAGDLGYSVLEAFSEKYPQRYLNAGVAEQNMTGIAAGLALAGKTTFTYSIANFPVFRCLEQVRNDVCYHNLNVKVVAVGGGLAYGSAGYSHHAVEDLAVMRSLPNMVVFAPADPVETQLVTRAAVQHQGPCYIRLGKAGEPVLHTATPAFAIGKGIVVRPEGDVAMISTGGMLGTVLRAADELGQHGVKARVISMPTVQPIDRDLIERLARETRAIVTVEEHGIGGLGSAVAEVLAECVERPRFRAIRLDGAPSALAGTQDALRGAHGLSAPGIAAAVQALVAG